MTNMCGGKVLEKAFIIILAIGLLWIMLNVKLSNHKLLEMSDGDKFENMKAEIEELQLTLDQQMYESEVLLRKVQQHIRQENNNSYAKPEEPSVVLPVLVMSCDRETIKRCLDKIIRYRPNPTTFPIIISQDCDHQPTYDVIQSFVNMDPTSISYVQQPDQSPIVLTGNKVKFRGYYKIARHYKFALTYVLYKLEHEAVIIVEDDLDISPDFFEYFLGTYPLLEKDPTLWCISAWNDNGKQGLIDEEAMDTLYRTDFFPGLGWLLRRDVWFNMIEQWPPAFFDDWLRNPENNGGRACIRPEISRTYSFGKVGVSKGLFFDRHLKYIVLNKKFARFTKMDLSYLMKDQFDKNWAKIKNLPVKSPAEVMTPSSDTSEVQVKYSDAKSFKSVAKELGAMEDFRSGIPRTAYKGIVPLFINSRRVYLAPDFNWTTYDPTWS